MTKDKWINIRCTQEQREDVTELAKQCNMAVSELFWYLVAKERKERSDMQREIERIRNIPKRSTISQKEMEKYRTPQNDEVRE
jgi:hypothetical protein